jgi:hypothetical protein
MADVSGFPPFCSEVGVGQGIIYGSHGAHMVRLRLLRTSLSVWIAGQHDLHVGAQHTLCEQHWYIVISKP